MDSSNTKRAIILKNTANPEERSLALDMVNTNSHFEEIDHDSVRRGPVTRATYLARRYEHQELPENFEDDSGDPDPYDLDTCSRIDRDDDVDCLRHVCRHNCELCRELALSSRYYIYKNVSRQGIRLDTQSSSTSSPNSDSGLTPINHRVGYDLVDANQPSRPQTTNILLSWLFRPVGAWTST